MAALRLTMAFLIAFGIGAPAFAKALRSTSAKTEFKRQQPCPRAGRSEYRVGAYLGA